MRAFIIALALLGLGCASTTTQREPANVVVRAAPTPDLLTQHFADAAAVQAVLQSGPDPRSACQVELYDHPELTPRFLTSTAARTLVPLKIPRCTTTQQNQIFAVVMGRDAASETPSCAFNDEWAKMHAVSSNAHPKHRRSQRHARGPRDHVHAFKTLDCRSNRVPGDAVVTYLLGPAHESGRDL